MSKTPKLRFKEFSGDWEEKKLGAFLTESKVKGSTGEDSRKLTVKLWGKGIVPKKEILKGSSETQYYIRKAGQLMYGKLDFLNCAFGIVPNYLDGYESTLDSPAFDIKNINPYFLLSKITKKNFYKKYGDIADGSRKAKRVHVGTFLDMSIKVPSLQEQEKIASFLSLIDDKISLQSDKVEALKDYKKGIMQKIFSRELRFKDDDGNDYPEWEEKKLKFILKEVSEKTKENNQYDIISSTTNGLFLQKEYFNREIASSDNTGYKIIRKNQVVLSPQNLWMGNINFNDKYNIGIVSPSYKIFDIDDNFDNKYIGYVLRTSRAFYEFMKSSEQGASIVRRNLNMDLFNEIYFNMPCKEEQLKIAKLIGCIDLKIDKEKEKLDLLNEYKKGLLQQMFV